MTHLTRIGKQVFHTRTQDPQTLLKGSHVILVVKVIFWMNANLIDLKIDDPGNSMTLYNINIIFKQILNRYFNDFNIPY